MRKKLPVGIESFEEFSKENFYYIDKTMFIADLLRNWGKQMLVQAWHLPIACGNKKEPGSPDSRAGARLL